MKLKMLIAAALVSALLFTACSSEGNGEQTNDNTGSSPAQSDGNTDGDTSQSDENTEDTPADPSGIVKAVLAEIPIASGFEKGKDDIPDYYPDIDVSQVESAAFSICASGAYPDEIAVVKCSDSSAVESVKAAFEKRLESQSELYSTYTPDEMYKLDSAKIFTSGNYAVFIALSDNDRAKEIVEEKIAG